MSARETEGSALLAVTVALGLIAGACDGLSYLSLDGLFVANQTGNTVLLGLALAWAETLGAKDIFLGVNVLDASGYLGAIGPSTLVVRVYRDGANQSVPGYLKVLRGRDSTLRGFRAGTDAGDTTAAGSLELRLPVTSPLSLGKLGVRAFIDAATVYDAGAHLRRQHFERGAGGGIWFTATVIRLAFDVAHGSNGGTRAQLSSGLLF